jgi:PAS domain S-box-containing protein
MALIIHSFYNEYMTAAPDPNTNGVTKKRNESPGKFISETTVNGFFTVDRHWTVKSWNKAAEHLLEVKAVDIIGRNLWEEFAGVIPINFYSVYHKAFLKDIPIHFEEYWAEMGSWYDVITCHYDNILSVSFKKSYQSTQPQYVEEQLKELNELYKFVTEVTNDCLWEWDLQKREMFWIDGGHKRVLGYPIENALIPQSFWESLVHADDKVRLLTRLNKILAEGSATVWEDEYRFKKADGDYAYVHDRGHIIYEEKRAVKMIGATEDITARKLAQEELSKAERKLAEERLARQKEITNAVLTAQEVERAGIGKELHDNLNQVLGAAKLYIELARVDEETRDMCLARASTYILSVIEEIRKISKTLVPQVMMMGLVDSIRSLLGDMLMTHPLKIDFQENGVKEEYLDEKLQMAIFRIIQEQLNNILKHSKATHAAITLSRQENEIILLIADNGKGCKMEETREGVGIRNIISRAELHHGSVVIESQPGAGYTLKVLLPLT